MRQSSEKFVESMLSENAPPAQASRLDEVAEMVNKMEQSITQRIDQANKALVEKLENQAVMPNTEPSVDTPADEPITDDQNTEVE